MSVLICCACGAVAALVAIDVLKDIRRQHREDRVWAEIRSELHDLEGL